MPNGYREGRYRSQDDIDLYFRDYGDPGSTELPLLCLTGLTRNSRDFERLALRYAAERRVISPDYRGRGRSQYDPNWRNYRPEVYLNDIRHLLALLDVHKTVVIGTSLGGILAMALGALQPVAIAAVVLNDIGPEVASKGLGRILDYISVDRPERNWPNAIESLKRLFPSLSAATPEDWQRVAEGTFRMAEDGLLHFDWDVALVKPITGSSDALPDLWPLFRGLPKVPVLAVRGGVSDVLTEATFERMAAARPDLMRATVPAVGHAPSLEEPIACQAIDALLGRLTA
jgi:pimeloyl-ACP methyl ester carboxylesterase